jgi:hypothetical protein
MQVDHEQVLDKYMVRSGRGVHCPVRGVAAHLHGEVWHGLHLQSHQHAASLASAPRECHVRQVELLSHVRQVVKLVCGGGGEVFLFFCFFWPGLRRMCG